MGKTTKLLSKSEKFIIHEFHDLLVLKRIVEQYENSKTDQQKNQLMKTLISKIKREEHIEKYFHHTYTKLEENLQELKEEDIDGFNKILPILKNADIYKNTLLVILSKGGELEKASKDKDVKQVMSLLLKAINADEFLAKDVNEIQKDMVEIVKHHVSKNMSLKLPKLEIKSLGGNEFKFIVTKMANLRKKAFSQEELNLIIEQGIYFRFLGGKPRVNYALEFVNCSKDAPFIISIRCKSFSGRHADYIETVDRMGNKTLIPKIAYAGIVEGTGSKTDSPQWLGLTVNGGTRNIGLEIKRLFWEN